MIPKIIHQIWIGDDPIPEDLLSLCAKIQSTHSDWEYKFWTNLNCSELIEGLSEKGKRFYYEMVSIKKWAWACDLLRLSAVFKYGGLYLDCDFSLVDGKRFEELPLENDLLLSNKREISNESKLVRLQNCIFAANENNEFIETLLKNIRNVPYVLTNGSFEPSEIYGCQYFTTEYFLRLHPNSIVGLPKYHFQIETRHSKKGEVILESDLFYGKYPKICKHLYKLSHLNEE